MDARSVLRLDLGGHRTLGLGAVSLWPLGVRGWVLGVDARARGGAAGLRARPRRLLRRAQGGRGYQYRRAGRGLGAARMGGAGCAVVGAGGLHSRAVMAGMGRPARCEQYGHQQHGRGQCAEHQRLPQQHRAERRGGGARKPLRPRAHHVRARGTGGRDEPPADAQRAPDCPDAGELRAHGEPRRPATGGEYPAAGGGDTPAARPVRGGPRGSAERRAGRGAHARAAPRLRTATAREQPDSYSSSLWPEHGRAPHRGSRPTAVAAGGTQESTIASPAAAGAAEGDRGPDRTPAVTRSYGSAAASGPSSRGPRGHCPSAGHTPAAGSCSRAATSGPPSRDARGCCSSAGLTPAVTRSCADPSADPCRGAPVHSTDAAHLAAVTESRGNAAAADPSSRVAAGDGPRRASAAGPARGDTPRALPSAAGRACQSPRSESWARYAEILNPGRVTEGMVAPRVICTVVGHGLTFEVRGTAFRP